MAIGVSTGEHIATTPPLEAWLGLAYLTVFGSIIAFSAYMYLLRRVRPALATSYAYVNPVVAVMLGLTVGSESLSGEGLIALPLILIGAGDPVSSRRAARPRRINVGSLSGCRPSLDGNRAEVEVWRDQPLGPAPGGLRCGDNQLDRDGLSTRRGRRFEGTPAVRPPIPILSQRPRPVTARGDRCLRQLVPRGSVLSRGCCSTFAPAVGRVRAARRRRRRAQRVLGSFRLSLVVTSS